MPLKVEGIEKVVWNTRVFESLEIEQDSKDLIEALVRYKIERDEGIDSVSGKGSGLVVLLHGYI